MTKILRWRLLALVLLVAPAPGQDVVRVEREQEARKSEDFLFDVQPRVIAHGQTAVLRWSIKGATKVLIEECSSASRRLRTVGTFGGSGSIQVQPKEDTTYVVTCEGSTTYSCASVSVRVRVNYAISCRCLKDDTR